MEGVRADSAGSPRVEYAVSIKVVARCPGGAVELNPGGLSERYGDIGALIADVRAMAENHFPRLTVEAFDAYFDRLRVEGELLERLIAALRGAGGKKEQKLVTRAN